MITGFPLAYLDGKIVTLRDGRSVFTPRAVNRAIPKNWEFIDGTLVCAVDENDKNEVWFPHRRWKREVSNSSVSVTVWESASYDLQDLRQEVIDAIANRRKSGISLGGKYTIKPFPVSSTDNAGIKACFDAYNVLQKHFKPL